MEGGYQLDSTKQNISGELPSLPKVLASKAAPGFDYAEDGEGMNNTTSNHLCANGTDAEATNHSVKLKPCETTVQANQSHQSHSISIDVPGSSELDIETARKVLFPDEAEQNTGQGQPYFLPRTSVSSALQANVKVHPQSTPAGNACKKTTDKETIPTSLGRSKSDRMRDKRFDLFKTWSGRLERQISNLRGKPQEEPEANGSLSTENAALPVERYFDALEGPELDTLKPPEESLLPEDKPWPFLLRFPISSFGICLGVSSQAILWKALATSPSTQFLHISPSVNLVLWCIAFLLIAGVFFIYSLKVIFYFEAVRREYHHPVRVNFFFAPWIACLFLALGVPPSVTTNLHGALWYAIMAPILCLELKIYGQWMSGGKRRLSKVANPSNHLAIVGNFVGALLGASMGLKEGPIFFFAVGLAHYMVLFVTLYQRLPTNEAVLPKELHPVFFLFVAAPGVACMAWAKIRGEFDNCSRIAYFIALFLYASLAVRVNFFRGFRFSLAWWAYTFPMTGAAIATIRYSVEVKNPLTQALSIALSAVSTFTVTALLAATIIHAFVLRDLFPNDTPIAISQASAKLGKRRILIIRGSPNNKQRGASVAIDIGGE